MSREDSQMVGRVNMGIALVLIGILVLSGFCTGSANAASLREEVRKASKEQQHLCIAMAKDPEDTDMETIRAITGVNQILNQFPKKLLQEMVEDGWNVLVTNKVRKTRFNSFEKQMEIPRGNYQVQTYRMMARYLNERSGYLCYRYEFYEKVYRPESGKFYHNYKSLFESDPDEYFADALYRYVKDGDRLHGLCPETWRFVDRRLNGNEGFLDTILDGVEEFF